MSSKRAQKAKKRAQRQAKRQVRRARHAAVAAKKEAQRQSQQAISCRIDAATTAAEPGSPQTTPSTKPAEPSTARVSPSQPGTATDPSAPTSSHPSATLIAPAYVLQTWEDCWDCLRVTKVFALAAEGIECLTPAPSQLDRFVLVTSIEWLSPDLQEFLKQHSQSTFSLDESGRKDGSRHYINHCSHCGAPFDNDALFESGEAFSPMFEDEWEYTVICVPDGVDLSLSGTTAMPERQGFLPPR